MSRGGDVQGDIAAVSWGGGGSRTDLFMRGADNTVYSKSYRDGTWEPGTTEWGHHEEDFANEISSPISALAYRDYWDGIMYNRIMLAALTSHNMVRSSRCLTARSGGSGFTSKTRSWLARPCCTRSAITRPSSWPGEPMMRSGCGRRSKGLE